VNMDSHAYANAESWQRLNKHMLDDNWGMGYILEGLAAVAFFQGEYSRAQLQLEESLALFKESGNKWGMAYALLRLANVISKQGDQNTAYALLEECLLLARELVYKWGLAYALLLLGQLDLSREDYTRTRSHLEESLAINRELGDQRHTVKSLLQLASVATLQGDTMTARALYEEGLTIASALNHREFMALALEGLAGEIALQGHAAWAVRLWGAAEKLREAVGALTPFTEHSGYEHLVAIARSQLGKGLFAAGWAEGRGMTPEQALAAQRTAMTPGPPSSGRAKMVGVRPTRSTTSRRSRPGLPTSCASRASGRATV
jgi:tetratricopeptide (TPR) repeat protein